MPKFFISTLLWVNHLIAIVSAIVITQRMVREKEAELSIAADQISSCRVELNLNVCLYCRGIRWIQALPIGRGFRTCNPSI